MLAQHIVPVVLCLPGVDDAQLRNVGGRTKAQEPAVERHVGGRLNNTIGGGNSVADLVAAEIHVQASKRATRLVDHARGEVVGPAYQRNLTQRGDVIRIAGSSRSCAAAGRIEVVAAVEQIASGDHVAAQLQVSLGYPVIPVERSGQDAGDASHRHSAAAGYGHVLDGARGWIAGGITVRPELSQCSNGIRPYA